MSTNYRGRRKTWFDTCAEIIAVLFCIFFFLSCWALLAWFFAVTLKEEHQVSDKNYIENVTLYPESVSSILTTEEATNVSSETIQNEYS